MVNGVRGDKMTDEEYLKALEDFFKGMITDFAWEASDICGGEMQEIAWCLGLLERREASSVEAEFMEGVEKGDEIYAFIDRLTKVEE